MPGTLHFAIDHKGMVWRLLMQTTDIDPITALAERLARDVVKRLLADKILLPVSAPN